MVDVPTSVDHQPAGGRGNSGWLAMITMCQRGSIVEREIIINTKRCTSQQECTIHTTRHSGQITPDRSQRRLPFSSCHPHPLDGAVTCCQGGDLENHSFGSPCTRKCTRSQVGTGILNSGRKTQGDEFCTSSRQDHIALERMMQALLLRRLHINAPTSCRRQNLMLQP